jgi:signal transduction histidine kinase
MPGVWRSNVYLLVSFPIGIVTFVWVVTMLSVGLGTLIIWIGVPILAALIAGNRALARLERRRAGHLLGEPMPSAYLPPHRRGLFGYLHTSVGDAAVWKDLLWLAVLLPAFGLAGFTIAVCCWTTGLGLLVLPAWYWAVPEGVELGVLQVDTLDEAWLGLPAGLAVLALTIPLTRAMGYGLGAFARGLLAPSERRRLMELERTRAGAVDAQAAELQRIERDLHDGAQARLVALAMDLGLAQEKLATDPEEAEALITGAHTEAKKAIAELRDLSRGIYPAILTDRGLGPALSSIAARNPVPVALEVTVNGRLPAATEAAAYFVTVEALTNVAKHSGAAHARVKIARRGETLRVEIADDGDGGADPAGAGLTGLRQRVEALDGSLAVQSGELGTTIRAELPCASSSPKT